MNTSDISTKITIHSDNEVEHDYLVNTLIPALLSHHAFKPAITTYSSYVKIDTKLQPLSDGNDIYIDDPLGLLATILSNLTIILKDSITFDYSNDLGFEVWFDVPTTTEDYYMGLGRYLLYL